MFARVSTYLGETERLLEGFRRTTEALTLPQVAPGGRG
jgi:hypothetical protein